MGSEDAKALMAKCRRLAKTQKKNEDVFALIEETLELVAAMMARQQRQASQLQKVAMKAGLNRKYL